MITDLELDLPLNQCSCGDPKGVGFWFRGCNENTEWTVQHTGIACRKSIPFFKTKREAQEVWNGKNS